MHFLGQAIRQGSYSLAEIEGEEDFEALRSRADFAGLLELVIDRAFPTDPFAR